MNNGKREKAKKDTENTAVAVIDFFGVVHTPGSDL